MLNRLQPVLPSGGNGLAGGILALLLPWAGVWMSVLVEGGPYRDTGDGVAWRTDRFAGEPWTIQIARIERARTNLSWVPVLGGGDRIGLRVLTDQVRQIPPGKGEPLVAINGDFYRTEHESSPGDPRGIFVSEGVLASAPGARDCFWLGVHGEPQLGRVESRFRLVWPDGAVSRLGLNEDPDEAEAVLFTSAGGPGEAPPGGVRVVLEHAEEGSWLPVRAGTTLFARACGSAQLTAERVALVVASSQRRRAEQLMRGGIVRLILETRPDLSGVSVALGGGPALVRRGKVQAVRALKGSERHPRSALGWDERYYYLVAVDGRQPGHSVGMTLDELGEYMASIGCDEALNLDGGGSTELWMRGEILNRPCYGRERETATALVLVRKSPPGPVGPGVDASRLPR